MKFLYKLKAFTLAEVMITLTIIGVISAIVVPVAFHSRPDENVMKFKKAHNTFYQVINTMVTSDKYYQDGDLGTKADGTRAGYTEADSTYFCNTFADLVSTISVNCSMAKTVINASHGFSSFVCLNDPPVQSWQISTADSKLRLDSVCLQTANEVGPEIVTTDDVVYYQANPQATFGINWDHHGCNRLFYHPTYTEVDGTQRYYKIFCIDGIGNGEDPFGYGIRYDGKIINGKRADEWLEKDIQGEN